MPFIGNQPAKVPLTSADITDNVITSAKIADGTIVNADINASAAIESSKLSITSPLSITGNSTAGSEIRLPEDTDNGSNYVALKAADSITSNLTFTLPSADGTSGQVLQTNGSGVLSFSSVSDTFGTKLLHVRDEKSSSSHAGNSTAGSFVKRTLNTTLTNEISGASISSSVITLPAGTYFIYASAPAQYVNKHRAKLRNTTDSTDTILGTSERSTTTVTAPSMVIGRFTIAAQKNFELQHRIETSNDVDDLGSAAGFGIIEVYADVQIWKVA